MTNDKVAEWWSLLMGAAACIEDAGNCLGDPDAKRLAYGSAKHYRNAAHRLWAQRKDKDIAEFSERQWWLNELDAMVVDGTHDQKRAVAVVRHLLRAHNITRAGEPSPA